MRSQLTIRLPDDLEQDLSALAKRFGLNRSDLVRMALEKFVREFKGSGNTKPYDRVASIIGAISSNIPDLGAAHRKYLLKRFKSLQFFDHGE